MRIFSILQWDHLCFSKCFCLTCLTSNSKHFIHVVNVKRRKINCKPHLFIEKKVCVVRTAKIMYSKHHKRLRAKIVKCQKQIKRDRLAIAVLPQFQLKRPNNSKNIRRFWNSSAQPSSSKKKKKKNVSRSVCWDWRQKGYCMYYKDSNCKKSRTKKVKKPCKFDHPDHLRGKK